MWTILLAVLLLLAACGPAPPEMPATKEGRDNFYCAIWVSQQFLGRPPPDTPSQAWKRGQEQMKLLLLCWETVKMWPNSGDQFLDEWGKANRK